MNMNIKAFECLLKAGHFDISQFGNEFGDEQTHASHFFPNGRSVNIFFNPGNKYDYLPSISAYLFDGEKTECIRLFSYEDIKPLKKKLKDFFAEEEKYFIEKPFMREVFYPSHC